ncbi:hypothetical protein PRUB_a6007 [Pseudoalteromonas rubra]|uniref:Uncharacterized protein n=1 Tax=Pseudoalteromonas rubra TaxID=43658 RepID=A0A8T0C455_9GAMM|nr:hypothetical protein PRUB_a6007 [Pseudoalteromonas rubra]
MVMQLSLTSDAKKPSYETLFLEITKQHKPLFFIHIKTYYPDLFA